mmetsp:Transcript_59357/g.127536  ORF Transcript_59357/g.127536 Transcript_59357/m.127536 type:complete len:210 (-) Transcript_59357:350-979(-)
MHTRLLRKVALTPSLLLIFLRSLDLRVRLFIRVRTHISVEIRLVPHLFHLRLRQIRHCLRNCLHMRVKSCVRIRARVRLHYIIILRPLLIQDRNHARLHLRGRAEVREGVCVLIRVPFFSLHLLLLTRLFLSLVLPMRIYLHCRIIRHLRCCLGFSCGFGPLWSLSLRNRLGFSRCLGHRSGLGLRHRLDFGRRLGLGCLRCLCRGFGL